jgi:VCBS repeat-containing protein
MRPIVQTRQLAALDANGIAEDQQLGAAGDLNLNGALVDSDGVAQLGAQREVELESAGNIATVVFTVYGTDDQGQEIQEDVTGINGSAVVTALQFLTVTRIAADAAFASDVEVGTTAIGASTVVPLDQYLTPFNVSLGVVITGTVDVTVEYTFDDVFGDAPGPFTWFDHPDLTNVTADADGTFISPVSACRLLTNSGVGTAVLRILQAGTQ